MREYKFRAWDKTHKEMIEWEQFKNEATIECFEDENLLVMQSTGLKDKNGVEIFEGDIIKEYSMTEVIFHNGCFLGKELGEKPEYPIFDFLSSGEVVGNIFENAELLKEEEEE